MGDALSVPFIVSWFGCYTLPFSKSIRMTFLPFYFLKCPYGVQVFFNSESCMSTEACVFPVVVSLAQKVIRPSFVG